MRGNLEEAQATADFKVVTKMRVLTGTVNADARTVTVDASDSGSGIATVEYSTDGASTWLACSEAVKAADDGVSLACRAADNAGLVASTTVDAVVARTAIVITAATVDPPDPEPTAPAPTAPTTVPEPTTPTATVPPRTAPDPSVPTTVAPTAKVPAGDNSSNNPTVLLPAGIALLLLLGGAGALVVIRRRRA